MRPFIILFLALIGTISVAAQSLDTLDALIANGKMVDAKIYRDRITDSSTINSMRGKILTGKLYQELFKQSLQEFGIKNNNWLAISCNAYVDGVTILAKQARVPDSLYLIIADCYEHCIKEAVFEDSTGSKLLATDLYYAGHYSATLWSLLSGLTIKDSGLLRSIGLYFYKQGILATDHHEMETQFNRARHYLQPIAAFKQEDVLSALKIMDEKLK